MIILYKYIKVRLIRLIIVLIISMGAREAYSQVNILIISPKYNVVDGKRAELSQVSGGIQKSLKTKLEDLSYNCTSMNFQDWDVYSDSVKVRKVNQHGAKFVISTKQIKYRVTSNPAGLVYEIEFVIQELKDQRSLEEVTWYDSKFIVYNPTEKNYDKIAEQVSEEFNYFNSNGQFKPRIKVNEYAKMPDSISIEFEGYFNDWLKDLLSNKFQTYVFYNDERIYPETCDNLISGLFSRANQSSSRPVQLIVVLEVDGEDEPCPAFDVQRGSEKYLSDRDIDKMVQEIQKKLNELINN